MARVNWIMGWMLAVSLLIVGAPSDDAEAACTWNGKYFKESVRKQFGCVIERSKQRIEGGGYAMEILDDAIECQVKGLALPWKRNVTDSIRDRARAMCQAQMRLGVKAVHSRSYIVKVLGRWGRFITLLENKGSFSGQARPSNDLRIRTYDMKTNQVVHFRQMFPRQHRAIVTRILSPKVRRAAMMRGMGCDHSMFALTPGVKTTKVRFFCTGTSGATRNVVEHVDGVVRRIGGTGMESSMNCTKPACPLHPRTLHRMRILLGSKGLLLKRNQSFQLGLPGLRNALFLSAMTIRTPYKAKFFLVRDRKLISLPNHSANTWMVQNIVAVAFRDLDRNGQRDIIVMVDAMTGIGRGAAKPFRVTTVYFRKGNAIGRKKRWERALERKSFRTLGALFKWARRFAR